MRPIVAVVILLSLALPNVRAQGSVAEMIAELKKGEPEKFKALEALEALGDKAADAAPALIDLFGDKSESVRLQAAITLGKIGAGAVSPLSKALDVHYNGKKETPQATRFYLVWSLGFVGAPAKSATPLVVKALGDPAADVRRKAAYTLGRIDADPAKVADALVTVLADSDNDVRQTAADALPKMGKAAVPLLLDALQTKADLRPIVIRILGQIGTEAAPAIPQLKDFLLDGKALADPAAEALASIGATALPALTAAANSDNATARVLAIRSLHKIGAPAVPTFVDLLGSKHVDVQRHVAALLGGMLVQDKSVVIALGYATKDKDTQVRTNALNSLRQMGSGAKLAEPYILALLTDLDPNIRLTAFQTLQNLSIDARPGLKKALANPDAAVRITTASLMVQLNFEVELATPTLVDGLKEKNNDLKMQAAHALSSRGLRGDEVLPIFLDGIKSTNAGVRRQAIESITRYGAKASGSAGLPLIAALDDADDAVANQAISALHVVGAEPKPLFLAMAKVLGSKRTGLHPQATNILIRIPEATLVEGLKTPELKTHAAFALSHQGAHADVVVPIFLEGLKSTIVADRAQAISSIARYGPKAAKTAGPALINLLDDPDNNICGLAMNALRSVGADPKELFPAMVRVLRRKDTTHHQAASQIIFQVGPTAIDQITALLKKEDAPGIRLACLQTLAMVGPPAKDAVPELIRALGDEAPRARMTAARALGNLGPAAKDAEAALTKATKDTDSNVQQIALAALVQIKADANPKNFELKGVLTPGDPFDRVRVGHFHVVHTYPMKKGQQYQIDLISQWDNFLRLENARGDMLAQDDDGGGFPNARIIFNAPEDGWYRIIVTTFSGGASGPYTLRVK